jgi:prevent-host-death family protein
MIKIIFQMPQQSISLREANQNFSRLMAAVERGEAFSITRRGREVARLTPSHAGGATIPDALANAAARSSGTVEIPPTEAALVERMRRLEVLVDKLLSALSSAPHR